MRNLQWHGECPEEQRQPRVCCARVCFYLGKILRLFSERVSGSGIARSGGLRRAYSCMHVEGWKSRARRSHINMTFDLVLEPDTVL